MCKRNAEKIAITTSNSEAMPQQSCEKSERAKAMKRAE